MNKKTKQPFLLGTVLVLFLGALSICGLLAWTPLIQPKTFSKRERYFFEHVEQQLESGAHVFRVADVIDFKWDLVCLFYGYDSPTPLQTLHANNVMNIDKDAESKLLSIEKQSDLRLLAFSANGAIQELIFHTGNEVKVGTKTISLHTSPPACFNAASATLTVSADERLPNNYVNLILTSIKGR